jgi:hypothetical protein
MNAVSTKDLEPGCHLDAILADGKGEPMRWRYITATIAVVLLCRATASVVGAEAPSAEQFEHYHQLIRPQPGESPWMRIPWMTSLWEARQKAAAMGKPLLIWGAGGHPLGLC